MKKKKKCDKCGEEVERFVEWDTKVFCMSCATKILQQKVKAITSLVDRLTE
jgi:formylmethanofuran dehydrogenase subunit E